MKSKRPRLILRKGIALAALALPAAGCANTPEEAFRAAFDDACETITACGFVEEVCATPASRGVAVEEILQDLRDADATQECEDAVLEAYADLYSCYSNLSCGQLTGGDDVCEDSLDEDALDRICPDL